LNGLYVVQSGTTTNYIGENAKLGELLPN